MTLDAMMCKMINYIKDKNINKFSKDIVSKQIINTGWAFDDFSKILGISDSTKIADTLKSNNFIINCFRYTKSRNRIIFTKEYFLYFVFLFEVIESKLKIRLVESYNDRESIFGDEFVSNRLEDSDRLFIRVQLSMNSSHDRSNCEFIKKMFGLDWSSLDQEFE